MQSTTLSNSIIFSFLISGAVPRKVLNDNYNIPLELDEHNQPESDYDNDLDEDDGHYNLNAIPPAPKLQGTLPRNGDSNATQITSKGIDAINSLDNQRTFADGKHHSSYFVCSRKVNFT